MAQEDILPLQIPSQPRLVLVEWLPLFVLVVLLARSVQRRYMSSLYSIPGPFIASVTRAWRVKEVYCGHVEKTELELHGKYGMMGTTGG